MVREGAGAARLHDLWADTPDGLEAMVEDAKAAWIEDALRDGDPVPEPAPDGEARGRRSPQGAAQSATRRRAR